MDRNTNANINTILALHMVKIGAKASQGVKEVGKNMYNNFKIVQDAYNDPDFAKVYDNLLDRVESENLFGTSYMMAIDNPKFDYKKNEEILNNYDKKEINWNDEKFVKKILSDGYEPRIMGLSSHYYTYVHTNSYGESSPNALAESVNAEVKIDKNYYQLATYETMSYKIENLINQYVREAESEIRKIKQERDKEQRLSDLNSAIEGSDTMVSKDVAIKSFNTIDKDVNGSSYDLPAYNTKSILSDIQSVNLKEKVLPLPSTDNDKILFDIYWKKDTILDAFKSNPSFLTKVKDRIINDSWGERNSVRYYIIFGEEGIKEMERLRSFRLSNSANFEIKNDKIYFNHIHEVAFLLGKEIFKNYEFAIDENGVYFKNINIKITDEEFLKFFEEL